MAVAAAVGRRAVAERRSTRIRALLSLLVFSAFFTQTRMLPGIETNFGAFEVASVAVCVAFFFIPGAMKLQGFHPLTATVLAMVVAAALSQLLIPSERWKWSLVDLSILTFFFVFVFVLHNIVVLNRIRPLVFLRAATFTLLLVGPWIAYQGLASGGSLEAVGPFRNRSHMASYMLTGFWLTLMFRFWPNLSPRQRWLSHVPLVFCLYAVAVSGRRSVYLALGAGLLVLGISFLAAQRGRRLRFIATAMFVITFVGLFYLYGARVFPRASFFQQRLAAIGSDLRNAFAPAEEATGEASFIALQRRGVLTAFRESPVLGIGWGGFYRSQYSPTGHEVHSTPLRFLAELGVVGIALYLFFMAYLLYNSARLALTMRGTPFGNVYLSMALALWSMSISYLYNRHVTERTFWLLLVVYLSLELLAADYQQYLRQRRATRAAAARRRRGAPAEALPGSSASR